MNDRLIFYWSKKGLNLSHLQFNSWTLNSLNSFFTKINIKSPRKMQVNNWFIPNPFIYSAVSSNWPYIDYPEFRKALAFCKVKDEIIILNGSLSLFDAEQKCKQRFARLCMSIYRVPWISCKNYFRYSINDRAPIISRRCFGKKHWEFKWSFGNMDRFDTNKQFIF